jgi:hypothetical protein
MSQITEEAEVENQESMADQVMMTEPELSLKVYVESFVHI